MLPRSVPISSTRCNAKLSSISFTRRTRLADLSQIKPRRRAHSWRGQVPERLRLRTHGSPPEAGHKDCPHCFARSLDALQRPPNGKGGAIAFRLLDGVALKWTSMKEFVRAFQRLMKEWSLTPSEMTPRQMSPGAATAVERVVGKRHASQRVHPAVNETRGHRLTLTILRCEIRSLESPAFGLGVLRAGRTGDAGAGCLRRQLLRCGAFNAIAITSRFRPV